MRSTGPAPAGGITLPPLTPGLRNLLIALLGMYVVELIAANFLGLPVGLLAWFPGVTLPWQPLTRFLVTGPASPGTVLFSLLAVYFFVPPTLEQNSRRELVELAVATVLGSSLLAFAYGLVLPGVNAAVGYGSIILAMVTLFGLRAPNATLLLMFIIPVQGRVFIALSGLLAALMALAAPGRVGGDYLGAFLGVLVWWYGRGPGKRRRELATQGRQVERELRRFTVLQGGQADDDLVH